MAAVLADMSDSLDSAEWRVIFAALVSALSLSLTICFGVLIHVAWRVHWSWYYLFLFFASLFLGVLVTFSEPGINSLQLVGELGVN